MTKVTLQPTEQRVKSKYSYMVTGSDKPGVNPQQDFPALTREDARTLLSGFKAVGDKKAHITQRLVQTIERRVR